ncbi:MAG: hypothetical protein HYW28_02665 [Rhodospirillales bacterium]|nr:hypothetical protein [Rhodospirillales bacterium]MBI2584769.1 hypothetical protein [Rhodospirillales bacterium]
MTGFRVVLLAAVAVATTAAVAVTIAGARPAAAQDIMSLQARVMQLEARVRDITTFRPAPPPTQGAEALRQRIQTLELTVAEIQNALKHLQIEVDRLNAAKPR